MSISVGRLREGHQEFAQIVDVVLRYLYRWNQYSRYAADLLDVQGERAVGIIFVGPLESTAADARG
jgi:hypothetical protein